MKTWICALALAACATAKPRVQTIAVDAAHENYHTVDGRYRPFADLLRGRGFVVRASEHRVTPDALAGIDVLVIANATTPLDDAEIAAVAAYVSQAASG